LLHIVHGPAFTAWTAQQPLSATPFPVILFPENRFPFPTASLLELVRKNAHLKSPVLNVFVLVIIFRVTMKFSAELRKILTKFLSPPIPTFIMFESISILSRVEGKPAT
jgi:hypothetical protein